MEATTSTTTPSSSSSSSTTTIPVVTAVAVVVDPTTTTNSSMIPSTTTTNHDSTTSEEVEGGVVTVVGTPSSTAVSSSSTSSSSSIVDNNNNNNNSMSFLTSSFNISLSDIEKRLKVKPYDFEVTASTAGTTTAASITAVPATTAAIVVSPVISSTSTVTPTTTTTVVAGAAEQQQSIPVVPAIPAVVVVPTDILQLWIEVGNGIDKSQTVVWKSAVESLDYANKYIQYSVHARHFIHTYTGSIIGILVEQQPAKIGIHERNCVQESLLLATLLTVKDIHIQYNRGILSECILLNTTLYHIFNKKKAFYKGNKGNNNNNNNNWNNNHHNNHNNHNLIGLPEVRMKCIEKFRIENGFSILIQYLNDKLLYQYYYNNIIHNNNNNNTNMVQQVPYQQQPQQQQQPFHMNQQQQQQYQFQQQQQQQYHVSPNDYSSLPSPSIVFPKLDPLHQILQALCDSMNTRSSNSSTAVSSTTGGTPTTTAGGVGGVSTTTTTDTSSSQQQQILIDRSKEDNAINIAQIIMKYIYNMNENELKKISYEQLSTIIQHDIQRIYDKLIYHNKLIQYNIFFMFWRSFILKLIISKSLPLKLFGWEQCNELIDVCADHTPPPKQYIVQNAGCTFVNGIYNYAGIITSDGYAKHNTDVLYTMTIPPTSTSTSSTLPPSVDGSSDVTNHPTGGLVDGSSSSSQQPLPQQPPPSSSTKKLTIFRCTMRSQQKCWFLSEADEEQPGTDRDIDYYQHKSKEHEEAIPPCNGWITCRSAGIHPSPTMIPIGVMVPPGKEYDTLEHQLAKWAIENEIVEGVLGDTTIHREVVARSTILIKFLASMSHKDEVLQQASGGSGDHEMITTDDTSTTVPAAPAPVTAVTPHNNNTTPNQYCLQPHHLLFAWKTCTRKADAAVSAQVYQLLVQILPSCPSHLAIPLLKAIQTSLDDSINNNTNTNITSITSSNSNININDSGSNQNNTNTNYLNEVAEFCTALASSNLIENSNSNNKNINGPNTPGSGSTSGGGMSNNNNNNCNNNIIQLKDDVREEVLNLLWSVLTYPNAVTILKSYDQLRRYVAYELRIEPGGYEHRYRFLQSCILALSNSGITSAAAVVIVDEEQALLMVQLTRFVLEVCPRKQAEEIVNNNHGKLPLLLYDELIAYLNRCQQRFNNNNASVLSSTDTLSSSSSDMKQHKIALDERFRILRFVYGLSSTDSINSNNNPNSILQEGSTPITIPQSNNTPHVVTMTLPMLEMLWSLCSSPDDREALMLFVASASHIVKATNYYEPYLSPLPLATVPVPIGTTASSSVHNNNNNNTSSSSFDHMLSVAFTDDVCNAVFINLFCSYTVSYEQLGENGYRSFQFLFKKLRDHKAGTLATADDEEAKKLSLDALWRVCLTSSKAIVANQAMKDLLYVYVVMQQQQQQRISSSGDTELMVTDDHHHHNEDSFGERIFLCLERVKIDLDNNVLTAELSAERCMRILNAAIGQQIVVDGNNSNGIVEGLTTSSALARLSLLNNNNNNNNGSPTNDDSLEDAMRCLPHGMRGQACYRRIGIIAKRPQQAQNNNNNQNNNNYNNETTANRNNNNNNNTTTNFPSTIKFSLDVHPYETLTSIKTKVASYCRCLITSVKPIQVNGRSRGTIGNDLSHLSLNTVPDDSVVDEIGIVQGCEVVFVIADQQQRNTTNTTTQQQQSNAQQQVTTARNNNNTFATNDLSSVFFNKDGKFADRLFNIVLSIVESLPWRTTTTSTDRDLKMTDSYGADNNNIGTTTIDTSTSSAHIATAESESHTSGAYKLAWELLLAMPTNVSVASRVKSAQQQQQTSSSIINTDTTSISSDDAMEVELSVGSCSVPTGELWSQLLDVNTFDRSVYVLLTIDALIQPAPEALSTIQPTNFRGVLETTLIEESYEFRRTFIDAGGFHAVVKFFAASGNERDTTKQIKTRRGNAVALRILKSCLFGSNDNSSTSSSAAVDVMDTNTNNGGGGGDWRQQDGLMQGYSPDGAGKRLLQTLSDVDGLLRSLSGMVVDDKGISSSTVSDVLRFLRLLFQSQNAVNIFVTLPCAERFLVILLMWDDNKDIMTTRTSSSVNAATLVRKGVHDLILTTKILAEHALPWLIRTIDSVDVAMECTSDYFDVLEKLVLGSSSDSVNIIQKDIGTIVCKKLASCQRPSTETEINDFSTGVLCGCLKLLRAIIERRGEGGRNLRDGANILVFELQTDKWSTIFSRNPRGMNSSLSIVPISSSMSPDDDALLDLMGAIFDGFLTPSGIVGSSTSSSAVALCCDKESRRLGFDVVAAAAKSCISASGYIALVDRINGLVDAAAPRIRHRWGQLSSNGNGENNQTRSRGNGTSKFSGLRNQGCTCYMNSFLQQMFMMPELRDSMCSAPLPTALRSIGSGVSSKAIELIGKRISLLWESGASYDALVLSYYENTGMHIIQYLPVQIAAVSGVHQPQIQPEDIARLPPYLPDEFILTEGRPGKETGVYDILPDASTHMDSIEDIKPKTDISSDHVIKETDDEAASRRLLEEFQRTFIHLKVGSKGRWFDPRALVEACSCLKLEFDVWQQNDASEFATKLLDRLEISLKRWAPNHFRYMDHTFGLKQTKQKVCRKCGLKTNREEKLLSIDCQIRGKSDIHEALSAMTEIEIMEGSNRVYCDNCKENTDTILKSAISTLPNMLILSLKRFDLDFTTFETVKLNSRCAFGQTLNMKKYTLEGLEALERTAAAKDKEINDPKPMDTDESPVDSTIDPFRDLPDDDYEYRLVGVLVHAGVAQGGHYYSFIKERNPGMDDKWFRFDDEDVTPFDPAAIESECFGGKLKKETKWPNGQVHTVEQEQFANALMLFYEKVKPTDLQEANQMLSQDSEVARLPLTTGYAVFEQDVVRANATHQRQAFLFDSEFQIFLKGLLAFCNIPSGHELANKNHDSCRGYVLKMLLSFVYDVLLYSSDCTSFGEWSRQLEDILINNAEGSISFVQELARKTNMVSANWLRTYLLECPDSVIRSNSARIFSAAIRSSGTSSEELRALESWCKAWKEQFNDFNSKTNRPNESKVCPCTLTGKWSGLENVELVGNGSSSLGIIISHLNELLEAMPRCWRFSSELCLFIRYLASTTSATGEYFMRRPMIEAQIPARLIALVVRDRLPGNVKDVLPGSSVIPDVASTQIRAETNPTMHVIPMSTNQGLNSDMNSPRGAGASDLSVVLEAVGCFARLPVVIHALLVRETDDVIRGRQRYVLTENAKKALTTVFYESCSSGNQGMNQRDIETYLRRSGVETGVASTQKILDILSKYPTVGGPDQKGGACLSLEGFLAYYRDCIQSNDVRLRLDLHTFGFRPDLSRRSRDARFVMISERENQCAPPESVARDAAEILGDTPADLGYLANCALASTVQIYSISYNISEPLMEYLASATTYRRDTRDIEVLIHRTLQNIFSTPTDWAGNDVLNGLTTLLKVIACTPGDDQQFRIGKVMLSDIKASRHVNFGAGLLQVLRGLHRLRQSHSFTQEFNFNNFVRYMHILKELHGCYPIYKWMNEHQNQWSFVERELQESRHSHNAGAGRNDYVSRNNDIALPVDGLNTDHNTHSDSDMAGMNDSDDDEDSQFDTADNLDVVPNLSYNGSPRELFVQDAGNLSVNGTYTRDGVFENACRYVKEGTWNERPHKFHIFQCNVSNNTKHWYISIVPRGRNPGTSSDVDFYTAPMTSNSKFVAPLTGWIKAQEGVDPPPTVKYGAIDDYELPDEDEDPEEGTLEYDNGNVVEDDSKFV